MSSALPRIPLVLIAGFLGAGKTTFLRALLPQLNRLGVPASVIVNDFANAEVDAALLRPLNPNISTISGSCVCCGSQIEFMEALANIEVPEHGLLLVEVNGASDMIELISTITLLDESRRFLSPMQFTLVDAKRWQTRAWHDDLEREQVKTSTHWQVTRKEEVEPVHLRLVRAIVRSLAPRSLETNAEDFAEELQALTLKRHPLPPVSRPLVAVLHHHHHDDELAFTSMEVKLPFTVHRMELEAVLNSLPDAVLRVKGLCRLAEAPQIPMSFQHVRPQSATTYLPLFGSNGVDSLGVVIGVRLPETQIYNSFRILPSAEKAPEFDAMAI